ncbi:MAG: hypothetical protein ACR2RF_10405 [Geminicoccaceae bacterium]
MTDLPKTVRIGYADYRVQPWPHHEAAAAGRYGECSSYELVIRIDDGLLDRSPLKAADTMLHEILHAIYWVYGVEDEDKEERLVGMMASALTQVWRDNPQVVAWLNEQLK